MQWSSVYTILGQRLRFWTYVVFFQFRWHRSCAGSMLGHRPQCWATVYDAGPTLNHHRSRYDFYDPMFSRQYTNQQSPDLLTTPPPPNTGPIPIQFNTSENQLRSCDVSGIWKRGIAYPWQIQRRSDPTQFYKQTPNLLVTFVVF